MVKVRIGEEILRNVIRFKVRFDYKGVNKPNRFFFGSKTVEKLAQEARQHHTALLRNVPIQGICIEEIIDDLPIYTVLDETKRENIAYAPVELVVSADTIEDIVCFIMCEEFRKIEILEPEQMYLSRYDAERFLFRMNEEMRYKRPATAKRASPK